MKPAIELREKISRPEPVLGVLISHHFSLDLIESCITAGLDYAIIDTEHIAHDSRLLADAFSFGRLVSFPMLLRPPSTEPTCLRLAMDLGPCGLLLPMIEIVQQLNEVCQCTFLPPRGRRRPGGPGNRWVTRFDYSSFRHEVEDSLIVIPQIESPLGLANASAIAAHSLTTAVGIGPFDLSAQLGVCGQVHHPHIQDAHKRILRAANEGGKPAWSIGDGPTLMSYGYRFICVGDPALLLQSTLKQLVSSVHGHEDHRGPHP